MNFDYKAPTGQDRTLEARDDLDGVEGEVTSCEHFVGEIGHDRNSLSVEVNLA
jgi:hypothetical protein